MTFTGSEQAPVGGRQFIYNFVLIFAALSHESIQDDTPSGQHFPCSSDYARSFHLIISKDFHVQP
jgi:hypothetical protein